MCGNRGMEYIDKNYRIRVRGGSVMVAELKQRVVVISAKVKIYEARNEEQRQNRLFKVDQGRLYQELDGKERHETLIPQVDEARRFLSSIWESPVEQNTQADWLMEMKEEVTRLNHRQEDIETDEAKVKE